MREVARGASSLTLAGARSGQSQIIIQTAEDAAPVIAIHQKLISCPSNKKANTSAMNAARRVPQLLYLVLILTSSETTVCINSRK